MALAIMIDRDDQTIRPRDQPRQDPTRGMEFFYDQRRLALNRDGRAAEARRFHLTDKGINDRALGSDRGRRQSRER